MKLKGLEEYTPELPSKPRYIPLSDDELQQERGNDFVFDIECYPNYFLILFKSFVTGKVVSFELSPWATPDRQKLRWILANMRIIGFNSRYYDAPMMSAYLTIQNVNNDVLKALSDSLIMSDVRMKDLKREFGFEEIHFNHIDLFSVAPSAAAKCGLKHYAGRMHVQRLQELPFDPHAEVSYQEALELRSYCVNDLDATAWLYKFLDDPIRLREEMGRQYGSDLRSLSDAQIAERIIGDEIQGQTGIRPEKPYYRTGTIFQYEPPEYMAFYTEPLQKLFNEIRDTSFIVTHDGSVAVSRDGEIISAKNLWSVQVGRSKYRLGIGGLHSSESAATYFSGDNYQLFDRDVASYYPNIILNNRLYPTHIGPDFLATYGSIVRRRLAAKAKGDKSTANSLKIAINGSFGKLGSKWSILYSPELLISTTVTGQLSLLMLIEMLEYVGIPVVSANTDGIVIKCPQGRQDDYLTVVRQWEAITNFETDETRYASIHSRDVNNYIAITDKGEFKAKGAYVNDLSMKDKCREQLMKNPNATIVSEAVMRFLETAKGPHPITVDKTIEQCTDIRKFVFVRRVTGGAVKGSHFIGKLVRFYIRKNDYGVIKYRDTGKKVSESAGGCPIMDMDSGVFPSDVDFDWYIRRANMVLRDVGFHNEGIEQLELF